MAIRNSSAIWHGNLVQGNGTMRVGAGVFEGAFSRASRFESAPGTNPEELLGAAHAGCYAMFLAAILSKSGFVPTQVKTSAIVHLTDGPTISLIELNVEAIVPGIDSATFLDHANQAKVGCPVSKALASVEILLNATLVTEI
jgi:osmotically inducible protein OsmC